MTQFNDTSIKLNSLLSLVDKSNVSNDDLSGKFKITELIHITEDEFMKFKKESKC
jgi:hypothetical protein